MEEKLGWGWYGSWVNDCGAQAPIRVSQLALAPQAPSRRNSLIIQIAELSELISRSSFDERRTGKTAEAESEACNHFERKIYEFDYKSRGVHLTLASLTSTSMVFAFWNFTDERSGKTHFPINLINFSAPVFARESSRIAQPKAVGGGRRRRCSKRFFLRHKFMSFIAFFLFLRADIFFHASTPFPGPPSSLAP